MSDEKTTKIEAKVKILNWMTGSVIYESSTATTVKEAAVEANLRGADLYGANLRGANLREANLRGMEFDKLPKQFINLCSRDMLFVFEHLKGELPGLRKALVDGKINGTQYNGECACLIGTLGKLDGGTEKVCTAIPFYEMSLDNPAEQWFWNIREGDTPKNSVFAKHAVALIDTVLGTTTKKVKPIKGKSDAKNS